MPFFDQLLTCSITLFHLSIPSHPFFIFETTPFFSLSHLQVILEMDLRRKDISLVI
jgi:hypothetical protein